VNELYSLHPYDNRLPGKKYKYRLPTAAEWEMMAAGGKDIEKFPFGYDSVYTKWHRKWEKSFNCIYQIEKDTISYHDPIWELAFKRPRITSPVESFHVNRFGLYNTIGNVSEMVDEKGISKGGNYTLPVEDCMIKNKQLYTKPECWLGFRCICIVSD
jgi:formylglycine-generating enzyme required for sulfatase activity